ncbi:MAG: phosphoribosylamine--glycine ligase, partial [Oscillospiraceae bacterium]|nr:phosphoribosylamine--glycine ligase [Oscillospiraceae bacterium]
VDALVTFAAENGIDFVVVASDDPLEKGLVDACQAAGVRAFGPTKAAAEIEWSKIYAKNLMKKYNIPTAAYEVFTDCETAVRYANSRHPSPAKPIVIKADGLAVGKGAVIARSAAEAEETLRGMMEEGRFGGAGKQVVIEEYMEGREVTALCFTDGGTICPMPSSRDHKRAFDNDEGLNTGGMGVITPVPDYTPELAERCMREIIRPTVDALRNEGRPFSGVLYFELMLTAEGPKVIEYNARFGDPEAQALMPLLESDLLELFLAIEEGRLGEAAPVWSDEACACVVLASGGYPENYRTALPVSGLDKLPPDIIVFHAGTAPGEAGTLVTSGGRVLSLCAKGKTQQDALRRVYANIDTVRFDGAFYRRDIGRSSGILL